MSEPVSCPFAECGQTTLSFKHFYVFLSLRSLPIPCSHASLNGLFPISHPKATTYPSKPYLPFKSLTNLTYLFCASVALTPSSAIFCQAFRFAFSYTKLSDMIIFTGRLATHFQLEHAWSLGVFNGWILRPLLEECIELRDAVSGQTRL
jgi:hypothetical protein